MNAPNLITLARFVLVPIYILVFAYGPRYSAFLIIVAAGLTDIADGYIARRTNQITKVGVMLDPLADKTMMLAVMVTLLWSGDLSWSAVTAMVIRDLGMIIGSAFFHFRGYKTVPANWMGKLTTVLLYAAIMWIFFQFPYAQEFLWAVIIFSFVTSVMYIVKFKGLNDKTSTEVFHR
ncbi:CDP-diacylglycerol--glycerol-3-phosphate 3-phosphatidyltransferase [Paenibacillus selenitireducens]|uniref:Phosphatidylglycerophosphate synthase n=1 Tax=Paenibacillus selenitireducens TaxID=1324314 RepID=A0A1T2X727_9BACL|nr:CDP-alcohol phosphatidyltransferase family protein [Paenibacillus selenitireducens]OPA75688.1 CDP-diacylglycerol--glycerol-3-phosphate 3-phosphatidyltransferase [Paenibacillus selenitireducens]